MAASAGKTPRAADQDATDALPDNVPVVLKQQDKGIIPARTPALVLKQDGGHIFPDAVKVDQDTVSDEINVLRKMEALPKSVKLSKHAGGRPKKRGEVSRVTAWRRGREEEVQGELQLP